MKTDTLHIVDKNKNLSTNLNCYIDLFYSSFGMLQYNGCMTVVSNLIYVSLEITTSSILEDMFELI